MKLIVLLFAASLCLVQAGSPQRAKRLTLDYERAYDRFVKSLSAAKTDEAQARALTLQPDTKKAGSGVWQEIRRDLQEPWTLEFSAWLLINTPDAVTSKRKQRAKSPAQIIREANLKHHLKSPKIGPYCIALTQVKDPRALSFLEAVEKENPSEAVRGAAALAQGILLRRLGDQKQAMFRRQEKLRAAIKAPDLVVGRTTTLEILKDELFRMENLTMGTRAPDFQGVMINQEVAKLRDYEGKVVILFFWNRFMASHDDALELMRKYQGEFEGKGVVILGVNTDNPLTLRKRIVDGSVTWPSFSDSTGRISALFRIDQFPTVFVLDQEQKIRYQGLPGAFVKITAEELLNRPVRKK